MTSQILTDQMLIAPCGINCHICYAYNREKKHCPGCRGDDSLKMKSCLNCKIKNCEIYLIEEFHFCFECSEFPCACIKHLDKRYRTKYGTSVIENLKFIEKYGINAFVIHDQEKWTCPTCGGMLCMHKPKCLDCDYAWKE